jgi:hypothetical protein
LIVGGAIVLRVAVPRICPVNVAEREVLECRRRSARLRRPAFGPPDKRGVERQRDGAHGPGVEQDRTIGGPALFDVRVSPDSP